MSYDRYVTRIWPQRKTCQVIDKPDKASLVRQIVEVGLIWFQTHVWLIFCVWLKNMSVTLMWGRFSWCAFRILGEHRNGISAIGFWNIFLQTHCGMQVKAYTALRLKLIQPDDNCNDLPTVVKTVQQKNIDPKKCHLSGRWSHIDLKPFSIRSSTTTTNCCSVWLSEIN